MSGNRNRNSAGSRFSLGGLRSSGHGAAGSTPARSTTNSLFQRSATDITISNPYDVTTPTSRKVRKPHEPISAAESVLQRSATDTLFGNAYHETVPTYQEIRKPNEKDSAADSNIQAFATDARIRNSYYETLPACQDMRKPYKSAFATDGALQSSATGAFIGNSYDSTKPASAADGALQRSATDPVSGIPYNQTQPAKEPFFGETYKETKSISQDVRQSDKSKSVSFGTRIRSAAGKATAKIKGLGSKNPAKVSEKTLRKIREEESSISLSSYPKKAHVKSQEAVTGLGPNVLPALPALLGPRPTLRGAHTDPLGFFPDTMTFVDNPETPPVPRIQVSQEADAEEEEGSDDESWRHTLLKNALYSASIGELNLTPRKSPSSARTTFDSPLFPTDEDDDDDEDDLSVGLLTPTRAPTNRDRSKDLNGSGRSTSGLSIRDSMSSLLRKPTGYSKLPEEKLTPIKEHAPVVSSPLRRGNSSDSLGSLEQEVLKQAV